MATIPTYDELPRDVSGAGSAWGLFGADDSIGRLNLITPETVRAAVALVRRGETFGLDTAIWSFDPPLDSTRTPARHRVLRGGSRSRRGLLDDVLDDYFPQIASQWDSLAHIAARPGVFYNGRSVEDVLEGGFNTIDHWSRRGVATRGVLLDVARDYENQGRSPLGDGSISVADLAVAREAAGLSFSEGCAIVIRTGFLANYRELADAERRALATELRAPGIEHSEEMARYLWDSWCGGRRVRYVRHRGLAPRTSRRSARPFGFLHRVLIGPARVRHRRTLEPGRGLAADCVVDGVYEFFLASAPLHVTGVIGSPANALAMK